MRITLGECFELDEQVQPVDLSIPLTFNDSSFTAFGLPRAERRRVFDIFEAGNRGCRCEEITFCAHTHTTHIESRLHTQNLADSLSGQLLSLPPLLLALLVDVDQLSNLFAEVLRVQNSFFDASPQAILIRTKEIDHDVRSSDPGFYALSVESVRALLEVLPKLRVLLIDSISLDPEDDGGLLLAHRAFLSEYPIRFIVELCHMPSNCKPGLYALAINAASFDSDAAPCRPVLYHLKRKKIN